MIMAISLVCIIYLFTRIESKRFSKQVPLNLKQETDYNDPTINHGPAINHSFQEEQELNIHKYHDFLENSHQQRFHQLLRELLPERYDIHCQVSILSLIQPVKIKDCSWARAVDFVITDEFSKIILLIELDDSKMIITENQTLLSPEVSNALKSRFTLLNFEVKNTYDKELVQKIIDNRI